jgi:diguanylate cyclase (GGDEF)-like protein
MPKPATRRIRIDRTRSAWRAVMAFGALTVVASGLLVFLSFRGSLDSQRATILGNAKHLCTAIDHELDLKGFAVRVLASQAEEGFTTRPAETFDLFRHLVPVPTQNGYELTLPAGLAATDLGSLTGLGPIPPRDSPLGQELAVATSLSAFFRATLRHDPTSPWIYYISRQGFLYIFPRVPRTELFVSRDLIDMHFSYKNQPLTTAERRPYWSKLYRDVGGKGLLATVSHPIFRQTEFVATVSLDIGARTLLDIAARHTPPDSRVLFLDAEGLDMLASESGPERLDVTLTEKFVSRAEDEILVLPIPSADWHIAVVTPRSAMHGVALRESITYGLLALFTLFSIGLIVFLARSLRKIAALSHRDSLTGLSNRRHFHEIGAIEFARARRGLQSLGMLVIDIDHFKRYNDLLGHTAGDKALRRVAELLAQALKRETDLLFRIGGEEFVVLSSVSDRDQTAALAQHICDFIREQHIPHPGTSDGLLTVSIGAMTISREHWHDLESAYRAADEALYASKRDGRNRVTLVG